MKISILFYFLIFSNIIIAQKNISGTITTNSGLPVFNASISILQKSDSLIMAFALSERSGYFKINSSLLTDSIIIKINALNYEEKQKTIVNQPQHVDFKLLELATQLPTVLVSSIPIEEVGDTINFKVQSFTNRQDKVIADILSKLPGIEIDQSTGAIKYNNKSITHYYIDGLDLLERRYNIANQNIPVDLVDQIQILAHDKDIKLFDSLKVSNDPAINIKLKSKARNKFIGQGKAGFGISPLLYDNELTGLMFRKEMQFISSYKNNNTGFVLNNELSDNVSVQKLGDLGEKNTKEEILFLVEAPNPPVNSKRFLFNNTHLVYVNVLRVLPNTSQIKLNLSYLNDNILANNQTNTTYFLPTGNIDFTEKINSFFNTNKISGNIFYTLNKKSFYLKNNTEFGLDYINQNSTVQNISLINQDFKNPYFKYKNDFVLFVPIKKTIVGINSKINFNRMPQQLNVAPGQFKSIFNQSVPYEQLLQSAVVDNFNTDNNISFSKKKGYALNQIKIGTEYIFKNLRSQTNKLFNQNIYNLNDSFRNNTNWSNFRLYAENTISFVKGQRTLDVTLPLELNILSTSNKLDALHNKRNSIFFNPSIDFNIPLSSKISFGGTYSYQHSTGSITQITDGFILKNYRTVSNNENILPLDRLQVFNVAAYYKNPINAIFANVSVSLSKTKRNIIYSQLFNNFFIMSKALFLSNVQQSMLVSSTISKYFIEAKLNVSLNVSSNYSTIDLLQQNKFVKNNSQFYNGVFKIGYSKLAWLSLDANSKINIFKNRIKELNATYNSNSTFIQTLKSYFFISKKTTLFYSTEFYNISGGNQKQQNYFFADVGATKKLKNTDVEIVWSNITSNKTFTTINNNDNLKQVNFYNIRPANVLVKFSFRF